MRLHHPVIVPNSHHEFVAQPNPPAISEGGVETSEGEAPPPNSSHINSPTDIELIL